MSLDTGPRGRETGGATLRISARTLDRNLDCTTEGIRGGCGAGCCKSRAYWPCNAEPQEDGRSCHYLGPEGCTLSRDDRPVTCLLYPLIHTPGRTTLPFHFRAYGGVCKKCYRKGPRLAEALEPSWAGLVGEEEAARQVERARAGHDVFLRLPKDVADALRAEHDEAERGVLPPPRSKR